MKYNIEIVEENNCDEEMHEYLFEIENYITYPFCDQKIGEYSIKKEICCDKQKLINYGAIVCKNCGLVQDYLIYN